MQIGDHVKLIGIPNDLHPKVYKIFSLCLGHIFRIDDFNELGMAGLNVMSITGNKTGEWIYVESQFLEPTTVVVVNAQDMLRRINRYLRDTHGRTPTEPERRIISAAIKVVGTDKELDLTQRNIRVRLNDISSNKF
jgi:hypothetical protein